MRCVRNQSGLHFSDVDFDEYESRIKNKRKPQKNDYKIVFILVDTKATEIRTRKLKNREKKIEQGDIVFVSMKDIEGTRDRFSVTYENLIHDVHVGSTILLDDGLIELEVVAIDHDNN